MSKLKDKTNIKINGFPINIEHYNSMIIIKDDNENRMKITKDNQISISLNLKGTFKSCKNNRD